MRAKSTKKEAADGDSHRAHEIKHAKPEESVFARIVGGTIPVNIIFEDEHVMAFHDINPQAPKHILVIPKIPIGGPSEFHASDKHQKTVLGHLLQVRLLRSTIEHYLS